MTNALLGLVEGENRPMFWGNSCRDRAFPIAWQQGRRAGKGCHTSCVSFAGQARELHACHRPSENAGSERTTTTCSNNGAEHQNNACMKGFALSCSTEFLQENGHKRRVWRNGVWAELLMPLIRTGSLASSGLRKSSERIIIALSPLPCAS